MARRLFPDIRPDKTFGLRGVTASKRVGRWLRALGMTDPRISPSHSWRHWFIGACRRTVMHVEVRSALTGHSARLDESAGYGDGMKTLVQVLSEAIAKVRPPLAPATGTPADSPSGPTAQPRSRLLRRRRRRPAVAPDNAATAGPIGLTEPAQSRGATHKLTVDGQ